MKMTVNAFVFMEYTDDYFSEPMDFQKKWRPRLRSCKLENKDDRVFIAQRDVEVDIPDDFNPVPQQVAALEKKKLEALATYQQAVAEINDRLSKLQAIEFAP